MINCRSLLNAARLAVVPVIKPGSGARANPSAKPLRGRIVEKDGALKIGINRQVFELLAFRSFRPEERNLREFYEAGVRLMRQLRTGLNCTLDVLYSAPENLNRRWPSDYITLHPINKPT